MSLLKQNIQIPPPLSTDWHPSFFFRVSNFFRGAKTGVPPKKFDFFWLLSHNNRLTWIYSLIRWLFLSKFNEEDAVGFFAPTPWIGLSYSILKDWSNPLIFSKKITKRKLTIAHILHLSTNLVLNQQFSFKSNLLPLATSFSCPDPLYIKEITDKDQNIERLLNGMNCIAVCIQTVIFWLLKFTQPT